MSEHVTSSLSPEQRPKKRKLRYQRTSNACTFCRKRKIRCSGTQPCEKCIREEIVCEYASDKAVPNVESRAAHGSERLSVPAASIERHVGSPITHQDSGSTRGSSSLNDAVTSRRSSIDPPQTFTHGEHVGPTSGVSFLYHPWGRGQNNDSRTATQAEDEVVLIEKAPLARYGDVTQADASILSGLPEPNFTLDQITDLVERYFQYISPTYRYLHHPTVKKWAAAFVTRDQTSTMAQKACVLLVCAQTLLHSPPLPGGSRDVVGRGDLRLSTACAENAKALLDKEPGPASLASVQARIGLCLYLLSTFRLNECRYCFSFAVTVATALGIHRRQSSLKVNPLEAECRKRTFWSAYVLDGYLSVMLGRPRLLRDDDIDQIYPYNIDDHDLTSFEPVESLPLHGNLEAFVCHAKLAKLCAHNNDQLYPLQPLSNDEVLERSNKMLDALQEWQNALPDFLKPRQKTLTGQRTFERQNTILKLALAHVRILATRRCLLTDYSRKDLNCFPSNQMVKMERSIKECISATGAILDTVEVLIEHGQCYGSFWSTQYIALVAISTFYVLIIQDARHALPGDIGTFFNIDEALLKTRKCHDHLMTLPPPGSQAERHHLLLSRLRVKAERSLFKQRTSKSSAGTTSIPHNGGTGTDETTERQQMESEYNVTRITNVNVDRPLSGQNTDGLRSELVIQDVPQGLEGRAAFGSGGANDVSIFSSMLTPNSNSDSGLPYLLDFGWESLDAVGASGWDGYDLTAFNIS